MPVTYYSSTGTISFEPVALSAQAVGPIEVAAAPTPPDETIAAPENSKPGRALGYGTVVLFAILTGTGALLLSL